MTGRQAATGSGTSTPTGGARQAGPSASAPKPPADEPALDGLLDAHCHLDLMPNADEVALACGRAGVGVLATTVTPRGYLAARNALAGHPRVRVAAGAHPWWVADGHVTPEDVALLCELVAGGERLVGEVGVDLSPAHADPASAPAQLDAFRRVARACSEAARGSGQARVLSLHAVRSASALLDVLEDAGCVVAGAGRGRAGRDRGTCRCVFHWFSGTSDELARAVRDGCRFSVNEHMLRTRRGREYCRQLPADRLLLETDLPEDFDAPTPPDAVTASLARTLATLAQLRGTTTDELRATLAENGRTLLA